MNISDRLMLLRLLGYVRPHYKILIAAILASVVVAAAETSIPALMKPLLDDGFTGKLNDSLWVIPLMLVGLALTRSLFQYLSNYLLTKMTSAVLLTMRGQMFSRLMHARTEFYMHTTASKLINAVVFEVGNAISIIGGTLINFIRDTLTVLGLLSYLMYLNWRLTLIVLVIFPVVAYISTKINQRLRTINRQQQSSTTDLAYIIEESAAGHKLVKLHGGHRYELQRFMERAKALYQFEMKATIASGLNQPLTHIVASIALSIILVIALMQSSTQGTTVGEFAAFITAMMLIISPIKRIAAIGQPLQRGFTAAEMVFKVSDLESELDQSNDASNATFGRAKGLIRFENVCFSYPNADKRDAALLNLNLTIQPGEVIALVGPSGGGKTTFINLLLGFFTPSSGSIFLDDIRLDGLALRDLRKQFSYVGQDTVLFNDTVMNNVAYGVNAAQIDSHAVLRAIEAANLSAFISELPNGLDTVIGDNGNQLSGGQRQRLAIARAIYKNAPIIILDEATSALDSESERQVQSALNHLMAGRTSIVIAHRLSTIEHANRIAVLKGGQIVEFGSHDELINLSGVYANLHDLQRLRTDSA